MNIIINGIIIAMATFFLHATTLPGMINHWVRDMLSDAPKWVRKPLFECSICMSPWVGAFLLIAGLLPCASAIDGAITLMVAGGINAVIVRFIPPWAIDAMDDENDDDA